LYLVNFIGKDKTLWLLIFITVFSWLLFPFMAKYLNPKLFKFGFLLCSLGVISFVVVKSTRNHFGLYGKYKVLFLCWVGYLIALLLSTLYSNSFYSLIQWCSIVVKFLFLIFLLNYMNKKFIFSTFRIYSNIAVLSVIFALLAACLSLMGIDPITTVDLGGRSGEVYFGTYYVGGTSIYYPIQFFRIQGLCEEPGTFGFVLIPALFWCLIVEKKYLRSIIIILGLMFSFSLGAGSCLLLVLPLIWTKYSVKDNISVFIMITICLIVVMYVVASSSVGRYLRSLSHEELIAFAMLQSGAGIAGNEEELIQCLERSLSTTTGGKIQSFESRKEGMLIVFEYLKTHNMGTGTALGMKTVNNSISVGYAVAALEAGIVGGILYFCLFCLMGVMAVIMIWRLSDDGYENRVKMAVALSVCSVLYMGAQRIQPDLSFWHMWLYSMLLYLSLNNDFDTSSDLNLKRGESYELL
jgi:hypothetical protein